MADNLNLSRINKFYGGFVNAERDTRVGVSSTIEELDIFENADYIRPVTIFGADDTTATGDSISNLTQSSGTATLTTSTGHNLQTNDIIVLTGAIPAGYNGTHTITRTGATTFTFSVDSGLSSPASSDGSYTVTFGGIFDFAYNGSSLYALTKRVDASNENIRIIELDSANSDNPGNWHLYYSSLGPGDNNDTPVMLFHQQDESGTLKNYLYYTENRGGSGAKIRRLLIANTPVESSTDVDSTTMTLSGTTTSLVPNSRIPRISVDGEAFFGHGQFIAKIDDSGVFTEKAFTLPRGWICVDFAALGDFIYILAAGTDPNICKVFIWDTTSENNFEDAIVIPTGGPQIIINHNEILRIFTVTDTILRLYELAGSIPIKTHQLENAIDDDLSASGFGSGNNYFSIPPTCKFVHNNIVHFGLFKSDKSGIYTLGKVEEDKPLALVLLRRFSTTDYSNHRPTAITAINQNFFAGFYDANASDDFLLSRVEGNNSPTRSSDALYESIWIDLGRPEVIKDWSRFFIVTKAMPDSCTLTVDARVDNATSYDSSSSFALTNADDQIIDGSTANTFWERTWTSVTGRAIQFRLQFASSSTSDITVFLTSLLSREHSLL